jgi:hypothetical protein
MKKYRIAFEVNTIDEARTAIQEAHNGQGGVLSQAFADALKNVVASHPGSRFQVTVDGHIDDGSEAGLTTITIAGIAPGAAAPTVDTVKTTDGQAATQTTDTTTEQAPDAQGATGATGATGAAS